MLLPTAVRTLRWSASMRVSRIFLGKTISSFSRDQWLFWKLCLPEIDAIPTRPDDTWCNCEYFAALRHSFVGWFRTINLHCLFSAFFSTMRLKAPKHGKYDRINSFRFRGSVHSRYFFRARQFLHCSFTFRHSTIISAFTWNSVIEIKETHNLTDVAQSILGRVVYKSCLL